MKFFIKSFFPDEKIPSSCLLFPFRDELLKAVCHFEKAVKIPVRDEEFLAYRCFLKHKETLAMNIPLGNNNLVLLKEVIEKSVSRIVLFNKAFSLKKEIKKGDILIPRASAMESDRLLVSPSLKIRDIVSSFKNDPGFHHGVHTGVTLTIPDSVLALCGPGDISGIVKKAEKAKLDPVAITSLDYPLISFMESFKVTYASILYILSDEPDEPVNLMEQALSVFLNYWQNL
ncbi:MAG: hypothetical protein JW827_07580 [Spirochaetes bacterium]|nr:hypothetical protein [Spirochaetota bacterium]